MHVDILDIKCHNVTAYRGKINNVPRHEHCTEHPDEVIEMFCEQCDIPVCSHCIKLKQHKLDNTRTPYQNTLIQFNFISINIGCQSIYNLIFNKIKFDFSTSHLKEECGFKTAMGTMSKRLKYSMENVQSEIRLKYIDILVCR